MLLPRVLFGVVAWVLMAAPVMGQGEPAASPQAPSPVAQSPSFAERARAVMAAIQKDLYNEKTGLYAQSVQSAIRSSCGGMG